MKMFKDIGRLDVAIAVSNMLQEIMNKTMKEDMIAKATALVDSGAIDDTAVEFIKSIFKSAGRHDISNRLNSPERDRSRPT